MFFPLEKFFFHGRSLFILVLVADTGKILRFNPRYFRCRLRSCYLKSGSWFTKNSRRFKLRSANKCFIRLFDCQSSVHHQVQSLANSPTCVLKFATWRRARAKKKSECCAKRKTPKIRATTSAKSKKSRRSDWKRSPTQLRRSSHGLKDINLLLVN